MTTAERWQAWEQATPKEQQFVIAWFIGVLGDDFDNAVTCAKQRTAEQEAAK